MTYYNADTSDLFLFALGNFFDINIVIIQIEWKRMLGWGSNEKWWLQ